MSKTTEEQGVYRVIREGLLSQSALKRSPAMRKYSDPRYRDPSPEEIESLIALCGWTQQQIAECLGLASIAGQGSSTVRKWKTAKGDSSHRQIPYSAWRLWLLEAGLVEVD